MMMKRPVNSLSLRLLPAILCIAAAAGCGGGAEEGRTQDSSERIKVPGYTVLPPEGDGWSGVTGPGNSNIVFVKRIGGRSPQPTTVSALAMAMDVGERRFKSPEELASWVQKEDLVSEGRMKVISTNVTPEASGEVCGVRFETVMTETGVPNFPGRVFTTVIKGRVLVHPKKPQFLVVLCGSTRTLSGEIAPPVDREINPFLDSIEFHAVKLRQARKVSD
jgi:hypothetical protein